MTRKPVNLEAHRRSRSVDSQLDHAEKVLTHLAHEFGVDDENTMQLAMSLAFASGMVLGRMAKDAEHEKELVGEASSGLRIAAGLGRILGMGLPTPPADGEDEQSTG